MKLFDGIKNTVTTIITPPSETEVVEAMEETRALIEWDEGQCFNKGSHVRVYDPGFTTYEIEPSKMTTNMNVKWLFSDLSRLFVPLSDRVKLKDSRVHYMVEPTIWWEVVITDKSIKFYLSVPNIEHMRNTVTKQVLKYWKRANVREVTSPIPFTEMDNLSVSNITLKYNSILSTGTDNPNYSSVTGLLSTKNYLKEGDTCIFQIGFTPLGEDWNDSALHLLTHIGSGGKVPRKPNKAVTKKEVLRKVGVGATVVLEEMVNVVGGFFIPDWEDNREMSSAMKGADGARESKLTLMKAKSEGFKTSMRVVAISIDENRRKSILRSVSSVFDPLNSSDNEFVEEPVPYKKLEKAYAKILSRQHTYSRQTDVLCSLELAKLVQVPDQKAQLEFADDLTVVQHRSEASVPKSVLEEDEGAIPFMQCEMPDGSYQKVYFSGKNLNLLCMPRVVMGEPGTGKTSWAVRFMVDAFFRGYGCLCFDVADGDLVNDALKVIPPELLHKVKYLDLTNTEFPIGLGMNEAFKSGNIDLIEDLLVDEILTYIELVSDAELNMRARQWVENAIKAVYTDPEATLLDVENMLNNPEYRSSVIPNIEDPQLRSDWEFFSTGLTPNDRNTIYNEAFRRIGPVIRKKALKNFILQKPKKDDNGDYLLDLRKWMDEGCLVLVKATEILGETIQTALVSFMLAKFNLAMISREDIPLEDRKPCFLILDEPDHYVKGSERWRNMLTRYRKYRCGITMLFHGWQQLVEADSNLPKIIRKSGPHYIIFSTDEDNLKEIKPILEPEFKVSDVAKGIPERHAIIRTKTYGNQGEISPAFMAKALDRAFDEYPIFNNKNHIDYCSKMLGRPKAEVMEDIFNYANNSFLEYPSGDTLLNEDNESDTPKKDKKKAKKEPTLSKEEAEERILEEMENYIAEQIARGEEPDIELLEHMNEILEEG